MARWRLARPHQWSDTGCYPAGGLRKPSDFRGRETIAIDFDNSDLSPSCETPSRDTARNSARTAERRESDSITETRVRRLPVSH